ncbi:MAG: hypothetical protein O3B43_07030 [Chloroflexi bacterium]|nr:hypothetical protein [Chloroflexota bacterium]
MPIDLERVFYYDTGKTRRGCLNRHPYPPEFIAALLETAERATSKDPRLPYLTARLSNLISQAPSLENTVEMKAIVPQLCWLIREGGGWFYGPESSY